MEPETTAPKLGLEQAPIQYGPNVEHGPLQATPETGLETGADRKEQVADAAAIVAGASIPMTTVLPVPVITADDASATAVVGDTPLTANDDDLIEKEWVDKAKKIVAETKDDPFRREAAVTQLQKDYQKKRYGRGLGEAA